MCGIFKREKVFDKRAEEEGGGECETEEVERWKRKKMKG